MTVRRGYLRGFDISIVDVGDRVRLCRPLLSLDSDPQRVYVADKPAWDEPGALVQIDFSEAKELATVLDEHYSKPVLPGQSVVVAGRRFIVAAKTAGIKLEDAGIELSICPGAVESGCQIALARAEEYVRFKKGVAERATSVFDEDLENAVRTSTSLSDRGRAAVFLLRKCGLRNDSLAMRQLASALQDCLIDAYQRLVIGFAIELGTPKEDLHRRVLQYIAGLHKSYDGLHPKSLKALAAMDEASLDEVYKQALVIFKHIADQENTTKLWAFNQLEENTTKFGAFDLLEDRTRPGRPNKGAIAA